MAPLLPSGKIAIVAVAIGFQPVFDLFERVLRWQLPAVAPDAHDLGQNKQIDSGRPAATIISTERRFLSKAEPPQARRTGIILNPATVPSSKILDCPVLLTVRILDLERMERP